MAGDPKWFPAAPTMRRESSSQANCSCCWRDRMVAAARLVHRWQRDADYHSDDSDLGPKLDQRKKPGLRLWMERLIHLLDMPYPFKRIQKVEGSLIQCCSFDDGAP